MKFLSNFMLGQIQISFLLSSHPYTASCWLQSLQSANMFTKDQQTTIKIQLRDEIRWIRKEEPIQQVTVGSLANRIFFLSVLIVNIPFGIFRCHFLTLAQLNLTIVTVYEQSVCLPNTDDRLSVTSFPASLIPNIHAKWLLNGFVKRRESEIEWMNQKLCFRCETILQEFLLIVCTNRRIGKISMFSC